MTNISLHSHLFRIEHGYATPFNDPYLSEFENRAFAEQLEQVVEADSSTLSANDSNFLKDLITNL